MIPVLLKHLRWRLAAIVLVAWAFYLLEPGFHQHGPAPEDPLQAALTAPLGIAFTLSNLAGLSMVILLAGFISDDRRRGYYRLYFSHPTRPLAFYALRWGLAYALAILAAALFLLVGQLAAWGELRAGAAALVQPLLFALVYGGLLAFFSAVLPRADGWVVLVLFFATDFWHSEFVQLALQPFSPALRGLVSFLLPPHLALTDVYTGLLGGVVAWPAILFVAGYGLFWLILAALLVRLREWP